MATEEGTIAEEEMAAAAAEKLVEILIQADFFQTARLERKYPGKSPNQERPMSTMVNPFNNDQSMNPNQG